MPPLRFATYVYRLTFGPVPTQRVAVRPPPCEPRLPTSLKLQPSPSHLTEAATDRAAHTPGLAGQCIQSEKQESTGEVDQMAIDQGEKTGSNDRGRKKATWNELAQNPFSLA